MSSQYKGMAFTARYKTLSNVLMSDVKIISALENNKEKDAKALWDTGATNSVIRPEIAKALNLQIVGKCPSSTPSGTYIVNVYFINILLPNRVLIEELLVSEGIMANCDILIGMDIISRGDFVVSNFDKKTAFSFRIPSLCEFDFVKKSYLMPITNSNEIGRNDLCPCGSGKKYKKCC